MTLLEIVVVAACAAMLLGVLYQFWVTATRHSRALEDRFDLLSRTQLALTRITYELAGSRRVLYPAAGRAEEALVVIDGLARPVTYWLDRTTRPPASCEPRQAAHRSLSWRACSSVGSRCRPSLPGGIRGSCT